VLQQQLHRLLLGKRAVWTSLLRRRRDSPRRRERLDLARQRVEVGLRALAAW
jgi:hypothetical protein